MNLHYAPGPKHQAKVCKINLGDGSLEVKPPKMWTDGKAKREESERSTMRVREMVDRKSREALFFPVSCGSGGSKSRLAKARGHLCDIKLKHG